MRIAIEAPALHVESGYGIQARHLARAAREDGHQVAVLAISGITYGVLNIGGIPHYGGGRLKYNLDVLEGHVEHFGADVLITLCDLAHQDSGIVRRLRGRGVQVLHWVPVDCEPLSVIDAAFLKHGGGHPVAMSRFGQRMMAAAGIEASYVPHSVDTGTYAPLPASARDAMRVEQGTKGKFVVANCAANTDLARKGFFEMYKAFAAFHGKHPDSLIWLHSPLEGQFDHASTIIRLGLQDAVRPTEDYLINTGRLDSGYMSAWYNAADVYLCPSWAEGFGVPLIESQACGLPVIGTDCSAVTELVQPGTGWRVPGEPKENPLHKSEWRAPWISGITQALTKAHMAWQRGGSAWQQRRGRAIQFAEQYDAAAVYDAYWRPLLARLDAGDFKEAPGE
jgi:glycosyltransferase involved in cell wall biosynthesis